MRSPAMMTLIRHAASLKLTLIGMALLALLSLAGTRSDAVDVGWTALPLAVLSLNLLAAIVSNRSFRTQTGLLVFHVGLLFVFAFIGLTVLTRFDGRVEVLEGTTFDPAAIVVEAHGWLHRDDLADVRFTQREFEIDYLPGLLRQRTTSTIEIDGLPGQQRVRSVDDRQGAEFQGYRFLATANKGFALVLGWENADGTTHYGAVHLPSYPANDWKQHNDWVTPAGQSVQLDLELEEPLVKADEAWTLRRPEGAYRLHVRAGDTTFGTVTRGEYVALDGGRLYLADLRLWMGYRIDYYPFLPWMFVAAMFAVGGLALHFGSRYLPQRDRSIADSNREAPEAHVLGA